MRSGGRADARDPAFDLPEEMFRLEAGHRTRHSRPSQLLRKDFSIAASRCVSSTLTPQSKLVDPGLMRRRHRPERFGARLGQPDHRGAAVAIAPGARDQPFRNQPVDDAGDIAVRDQQEARQVAHQHAFGRAVERRHHVEARQRRVEFLLQPLAQLGLDGARGPQQPDPQPQPFLAVLRDAWCGQAARSPCLASRDRNRLAGDRCRARRCTATAPPPPPPPAR